MLSGRLQHLPTSENVWKSFKHRDLTKKTREFLWKSTHDAFKIGNFWSGIETLEHRGVCPHCEVEELMEHILTDARHLEESRYGR